MAKLSDAWKHLNPTALTSGRFWKGAWKWNPGRAAAQLHQRSEELRELGRMVSKSGKFAFGILIGAVVASASAQDRDTAVTPVSSGVFLSSLGICTHVDQGYDASRYEQPLRYLGVRNIRDGASNLPGLLMLHARTGVLVDLFGADVSGLRVAARTLAQADALLSIEGPNEPNNFPIIYNGRQGGGTSMRWLPGWTPEWLMALLPDDASWLPVAQLQKDLYSAVRSDPELSRYPIFHVSEGGAETNNAGLQFLTIPAGAETLLPDETRFADYANAHNYVSGIRVGYVDNQAWQAADPLLDSSWDGLYGEYGRTWKRHFKGYSNAQLQALPRVTTETGWEAATLQDERIQGIILVNTYLAQFKRGWRYTFIYELGEGEGGGGNFGLFHPDWTPKLAATYIHNLTSILADGSGGASSRNLGYVIPNSPATVHDLLLRKNSGVFELVIWGEQVNGANNITVHLDKTYPTVKVYDTTLGSQPTQTLTDVTNIPLTIGDHALILEIP